MLHINDYLIVVSRVASHFPPLPLLHNAPMGGGRVCAIAKVHGGKVVATRD